MAKLKLPFELEKPSNNEYVTQASQIGYGSSNVNDALGEVITEVDNASLQIGTIVKNISFKTQSSYDSGGSSLNRYCAKISNLQKDDNVVINDCPSNPNYYIIAQGETYKRTVYIKGTTINETLRENEDTIIVIDSSSSFTTLEATIKRPNNIDGQIAAVNQDINRLKKDNYVYCDNQLFAEFVDEIRVEAESQYSFYFRGFSKRSADTFKIVIGVYYNGSFLQTLDCDFTIGGERKGTWSITSRGIKVSIIAKGVQAIPDGVNFSGSEAYPLYNIKSDYDSKYLSLDKKISEEGAKIDTNTADIANLKTFKNNSGWSDVTFFNDLVEEMYICKHDYTQLSGIIVAIRGISFVETGKIKLVMSRSIDGGSTYTTFADQPVISTTDTLIAFGAAYDKVRIFLKLRDNKPQFPTATIFSGQCHVIDNKAGLIDYSPYLKNYLADVLGDDNDCDVNYIDVDSSITTVEKFFCFYESKRMKEDCATPIVSDIPMHDVSICVDEDYIYTIGCDKTQGGSDITDGGDAYVKFIKYTKAGALVGSIMIAEPDKIVSLSNGDSITMDYGGSMANMVDLGDGKLTILFSCHHSDKFTLLKATYNKSTEEIIYTQCKIGNDDVSIAKLVELGCVMDKRFNQTRTDCSINTNGRFSDAFDGTNYYVGVCGAKYMKTPAILQTADFENFTLYKVIEEKNIHSAFECTTAVCEKNSIKYLYVAARQNSKKVFFGIMILSNKSWVYNGYINATDSRPCLFVNDNRCYLAYSLCPTRNVSRILHVTYDSPYYAQDWSVSDGIYPNYFSITSDTGLYVYGLFQATNARIYRFRVGHDKSREQIWNAIGNIF